MVFLYCQNTLEITHAQPIRNAMNPMPISRLIVSFSGAGVAGWSGLCSSVWLSPVPGRPTVVRMPVFPTVTFAPRGPADALTPVLPTLSVMPGRILMRRSGHQGAHRCPERRAAVDLVSHVVFSAGFHVRHPCGLSVPKNIYRMWLI